MSEFNQNIVGGRKATCKTRLARRVFREHPNASIDESKDWVRCIICNWPIDETKTLPSGSDTGLVYTEVDPPGWPHADTDQGAARCTAGYITDKIIGYRVDGQGNEITRVRTKRPDAKAGCPFCGSLNYRGEF